MAKITHIVVAVNHETGEFEVDEETTLCRFDGPAIFDTDTDEWVFNLTSLDKRDIECTDAAWEVLRSALKDLSLDTE